MAPWEEYQAAAVASPTATQSLKPWEEYAAAEPVAATGEGDGFLAKINAVLGRARESAQPYIPEQLSTQEQLGMEKQFSEEHPYIYGAGAAISDFIPKSWEDVKHMATLPQPSKFETQDLPASEQLAESWRGEHGPIEQARSIVGTALQAAPLLHLPFAESPLRPSPADLSLVDRIKQAQPPQAPPEIPPLLARPPEPTLAERITQPRVEPAPQEPLAPVTPETPPERIRKAVDRYDFDEQHAGASDLAMDLDEIENLPKPLDDALQEYHNAVAEDRAEWGERSDLPEQYGDKLYKLAAQHAAPEPLPSVAEAPEAAPAHETAWTVTRDEWYDQHLDDEILRRKYPHWSEEKKSQFGIPPDPDIVHKESVAAAIREGKSVSPEVLADYPDLVPTTQPEAAPPPVTPAERNGQILERRQGILDRKAELTARIANGEQGLEPHLAAVEAELMDPGNPVVHAPPPVPPEAPMQAPGGVPVAETPPAHLATKEQVTAGHPELVYDPQQLSPGTLASRGWRGTPGSSPKVTVVGDKFFDLPPVERQALLTHELGHDVAAKILSDPSWTQLMEPLRIQDGSPLSVRSKYSNPVGVNPRPEEILSDIHEEIAKRGMPKFDDPGEWSPETAAKLKPIYEAVERAAKPPEPPPPGAGAVPPDYTPEAAAARAAQPQPATEPVGGNVKGFEKVYGPGEIEAGGTISPEDAWDTASARAQSGKAQPYGFVDRARTGAITPEEMGDLIYEHHRLVERAAGLEGMPEYAGASQAAKDFASNVLKPAETAWHQKGMVMQIERPVNLNTFTGMDQLMQTELGRGIKPSEAPKFTRMAEDVKNGESEVAKAVERSDARVRTKYAKVRDIPIEEAVARVKQMLKDCM